MLKIGITGIYGLLGWHLRSYLHSLNGVEVFGADRATFADESKLSAFVSSCDAVVHFAGLNRGDEEELLKTNIDLTEKLIKALVKSDKKAHVVFSSSTHIYRNTVYGKCKIECARMLEGWAQKNKALFANCILPNIFGECGKPFYNSVVSTFCHQIANQQQPRIIDDAEIEFMHAGEVARKIYDVLLNKKSGDLNFSGSIIKVSDLLNTIQTLAASYSKQIIPDLKDAFTLQMFNTYRSYLYPGFYPVRVNVKKDDRGEIFESVKSLGTGQCFLSTTKPGITRGEHYHLNKFERFMVVKGKAVIRIRRLFSNQIREFEVDGHSPMFIDIPTLHTHNITNLDKNELITLFWSGGIFDPDYPDTFLEKVEVDSEKN